MISVTVQAYGQASLLLDSGATTLVLLQWRNRLQASVAEMRLRTVNGSLPCESTKDRVSLGKGTVSDFMILKCQSETVKPREHTGFFPPPSSNRSSSVMRGPMPSSIPYSVVIL